MRRRRTSFASALMFSTGSACDRKKPPFGSRVSYRMAARDFNIGSRGSGTASNVWLRSRLLSLPGRTSRSRLPDSAISGKGGLVASNNKHLRVLTAIVTSRPRAEISADIGQAEKLGVLVMSRENLEQAVSRTLVLPNAEQLYEEAIKTVEAAKAKYKAQAPLLL